MTWRGLEGGRLRLSWTGLFELSVVCIHEVIMDGKGTA